MKNNKKISYFMNWFFFQYDFLNRQLSNIFDFFLKYPNISDHTPGWKYIPLNIMLIKNLYNKWDIKKYDIVHFNNTENFLNFRKYDNQISIAESHWFDFGVYYKWLVKDEKNVVKFVIWNLINLFVWWKIRKKIQQFDIYYCSTPDMLEPLKKYVRKDVKWLPNPVNTNIFSPKWAITKLKWEPACFFPTRLHWDKKPEYAVEIFKKYIKPKFPKATLHLLNQWFELKKYKNILIDKNTYFWHDFMDKKTLASKIRWADLCFWDFSIWALSLMPMQIMACKKPIITYDVYEIVKIDRDNLISYTKKILEDKKFQEETVERNYNYILDFHTEKSISKIHLENLKPLIKSKLNNYNKINLD